MCAQRIHLPGQTWNRRQILAWGGSLLAAWPTLEGIASAGFRRNVAIGDYPFALGVASGDPAPDGFVIWTRLAPKPLEETGGMPNENVEVRWTVCHDEAMTKVAAQGTVIATPDMGHSVHVEVPGLDPNRWYFYQFAGAGEISPKGRARTAPKPEETPSNLKFAFASCQHYESGYFTAYDHLAREGFDLVAHLGDYIYEREGKNGKLRAHAGPHLDQLADYRVRHAQYKTDPHLQAAHAMCPWLVTWDDHEFENNYANDISEHPQSDRAKADAYMRRRANAYQAYYENMPLRTAQMPTGPDMQLYRSVKYGKLVDFDVLDTRQYRTDQPCGDGNKAPCNEVFHPEATILGPKQEAWLADEIAHSDSIWNVLAQQVMMGRVDRDSSDAVGYSMDQWPGYEVNRQRMLNFFAQHPEKNPVVLTGDIHCNWANDLQVNCEDVDSPAVAVEFVGTSISSGGDGSEERKDTALVMAQNPFVKFNNYERGYVACEITPQTWTTHYRTVPFVSKPDAPLNTRASFVVEAGKPGLNRA
ncbi:alkaline phosphatase D family protein [Blastopirellula sp. J2-11]|uniref:alkaline phosphatase D family protein n=1 Tax=Blastopirellula sp. J2-11 TaxID=2943192 RepID=UPI0021C984F6|nr:alkaline phosphatase D family protein [Blastopirellula sp. J2-11]UUO07497.1 alkaline phosphatase D family protein [Blastopirellula sp. J2-11]